MASKFLARPLGALDRIYRLLEGQSPLEVETTLPVQLVHDLSRMSELGGPNMGFFISGQDQGHAGSDTQENAWNPYAEVGYLYPNVTDLWVWVLNAWVTATSQTVFGSATLAVGYAPYSESFVRRDRMIGCWLSEVDIFDQNVAPANLPTAALPASASYILPTNFPVLVPPGSTLRVRSIAGAAAGTIRVECICWAGPKGTYPPVSA